MSCRTLLLAPGKRHRTSPLMTPWPYEQHLDNLRLKDFTKKSRHNRVICSPGRLFRLAF